MSDRVHSVGRYLLCYRLTAVMISHFLIDLHAANERMTHQASFLTLDVMSRLDTPGSIAFHDPFGSDSSDSSTDYYDGSTTQFPYVWHLSAYFYNSFPRISTKEQGAQRAPGCWSTCKSAWASFLRRRRQWCRVLQFTHSNVTLVDIMSGNGLEGNLA